MLADEPIVPLATRHHLHFALLQLSLMPRLQCEVQRCPLVYAGCSNPASIPGGGR